MVFPDAIYDNSAFITTAVNQQLALRVRLRKEESAVLYSGEWGRLDQTGTVGETAVVAGICLFDGRWRINFPQGQERTLVDSQSRASAIGIVEKVRKNPQLLRGLSQDAILSIPVGLRQSYHGAIIDWQSQVLSAMPDCVRVLYHVPVLEYIAYLDKLIPYLPASVIDAQIERMKSLGEELKKVVLAKFKGREVQFIEPIAEKPEVVDNILRLRPGLDRSVASYLSPYTYPAKWLSGATRVLGIEDIVELKLAYTAAEITPDIPRMLRVCIASIPDPYPSKDPCGPVKQVPFPML
jgi:hypothetical protein